MKATIYKTNGEVIKTMPKDEKHFTLEELQEIVGGTIDIIYLIKHKMIMVLNDNGKLEGLPKNPMATEIFKFNFPITDYAYNNDELVVGDVLVCEDELVP